MSNGATGTTLLVLASEEGGTIRLHSLEDGRLELRATALVPVNIQINNLDREAAVLIRDAITRWLKSV